MNGCSDKDNASSTGRDGGNPTGGAGGTADGSSGSGGSGGTSPGQSGSGGSGGGSGGAGGSDAQPPGTDAAAGRGGSDAASPDASGPKDGGGADGGKAGSGKSRVYIVKTTDRAAGIAQLLSLAGLGFAAGKDVVLKPNFNSSNPFPASTHDDTIRAVVTGLKGAGCGKIVLGESSGPSGTQAVIAAKGTLAFCQDLGIEFLDFDQMAATEWESFNFTGIGWSGGLAIPKIMRSGHAVVLMPCCKTHGFGGDFTMSLKLAVGLTPKTRRMTEMHVSPNIRSMIADINYGYKPDLIVMDAISCFITGGPDSGTVANPSLLLAGSDRIAVDAVGVAVLKSAGSTTAALTRKIFEQDQIARAVQIGLGAASPAQIELVGDDAAVISQLRGILDEG